MQANNSKSSIYPFNYPAQPVIYPFIKCPLCAKSKNMKNNILPLPSMVSQVSEDFYQREIQTED